MQTKKTIITEDNNLNNNQNSTNSPMSMLSKIIWTIAMIIVVILAIRFVFILLGANTANGFVNFIYNISYPFARPFFGIFSYHIHYGVSRVEIASLIGIVIYLLVAYLIGRLLNIANSHQSY